MAKPEAKTFKTKAQGGKPMFTERGAKLFKQFFLDHDGEFVWIKTDLRKPKRSLAQNNLYWLYLDVIAEDTGHQPGDLHDWAKSNFLTEKIVEVYGKKVRKRKSTTELTKGEFIEYLMKIEAETGIAIPDTDEWREWTAEITQNNDE